MEKCPSSIWCQDLNTQPSEHEPPPITTRLGLPLNLLPSSSLEDVFRFRCCVLFLTQLGPFIYFFVLPRCEFIIKSLSPNYTSKSSVTIFGEILTLWQKSTGLWQVFDGLFLIWQNAYPTLANL